MMHRLRTRLFNMTKTLNPFRRIFLIVIAVVTVMMAYSAKSGRSVVTAAEEVKAKIVDVLATQKGAWNVGIVGTPTVKVGNAPEVNAAQRGAWNVGINGIPTVIVGNAPSVTVDSPVTIANSPATPLLVRETLEPFAGFASKQPQIPDGKLLVIDFVSGGCRVPAKDDGLEFVEFCADFEPGACFAMVPVRTGSGMRFVEHQGFIKLDFFSFAQQTRLYIRKEVGLNWRSAPNVEGTECFATFSGHLIDDLPGSAQ